MEAEFLEVCRPSFYTIELKFGGGWASKYCIVDALVDTRVMHNELKLYFRIYSHGSTTLDDCR